MNNQNPKQTDELTEQRIRFVANKLNQKNSFVREFLATDNNVRLSEFKTLNTVINNDKYQDLLYNFVELEYHLVRATRLKNLICKKLTTGEVSK